MNPKPDGPKKLFCIGEPAGFVLRKDAILDQIRRAVGVVDVLADPKERVQIAECAFAFLDIRFEHVAGTACARMAFMAFVKFCANELLSRS